jgi:hypothetical protein
MDGGTSAAALLAAPDDPAAEDSRAGSPWARAAGARAKRVDRTEELLREIHSLREAIRESMEQYERRVNGQLAEVVRALHRGENHLPAIRTSEVMLRAMRGTELKPHRGRAKDLVRIQELVAELTELITPKK